MQKISIDGNIEGIEFKHISDDNRARMPAQLVADDVLKLSDQPATDNKLVDVQTLAASVVYLEVINASALRKAARYRRYMINDESSRGKVHDDFLNEPKAGLKNTNSMHILLVDISLIFAEEAGDFYPPDSLE